MPKKKKNSGGKREGAGVKSDPIRGKKKRHNVMLHEDQHKAICDEYGGLSKGVQTLADGIIEQKKIQL